MAVALAFMKYMYLIWADVCQKDSDQPYQEDSEVAFTSTVKLSKDQSSLQAGNEGSGQMT